MLAERSRAGSKKFRRNFCQLDLCEVAGSVRIELVNA